MIRIALLSAGIAVFALLPLPVIAAKVIQHGPAFVIGAFAAAAIVYVLAAAVLAVIAGEYDGE